MTAFADVTSAVEALREGAADYILKPLQLDALQVTLRRALENWALRRRVNETQRRHRLRYNFDAIVASSPAMAKALADARKMAAARDATILILGESGTGKDLLAKATHYESERAPQPFLEITSTAIPEHLLESELFGHERGSFTGAAGRKRGLLELATGGTVFLNEVGHIPGPLQPKLLRVIEDKAFRRVGGTEDLTLDARIIFVQALTSSGRSLTSWKHMRWTTADSAGGAGHASSIRRSPASRRSRIAGRAGVNQRSSSRLEQFPTRTRTTRAPD